jgi:4-amino-4-deoxy-L-arabinose transferase-like glycosyltransferase
MTTLITFISGRRLAVVLGLALLVRLTMLLLLRDTLDFEQPGAAIHGSEAYDAYALNLLSTGVYGREPGVPDASIPPMYSYALAVVYALFGRGFVQVGLFHIALDLAAVGLLYDTARRLFGGERGAWIGFWAGVFTACYPYLVFQNLTLIDTGFWMLLLHLFVWVMLLLRTRPGFDRGTLLLGLAAGLVLGVATLTRPITPPLALLLALWFLFRLPLRAAFVRLLPVALVSAACVGLWIGRNFAQLGAFIPMTTTSGANFWQGNSEWTIPVFQAGYDVQWTKPEGVPSSTTDRDADAQRFAKAFDFLRANPDRIPLLLWTKFVVHWNPQITPLYNPRANERWELDDTGALRVLPADATIAGVTAANVSYNDGLLDRVGRPAHLLYFGGLLLLAIVSVPVTWHLWRDVSLLWFVQLSMTIMYVAFHPSTRYRSPSDPLLFVMSAAALVLLWGRWRQRA